VLLPWYAVWLLPFGAIGGRRLRVAALAATVAVIALRIGDFMPAEAARLGALGA